MPASKAIFTRGSKRAKPSAIEQLVLRSLKLSVAAANTATSLTPAFNARSRPFKLGVKAL